MQEAFTKKRGKDQVTGGQGCAQNHGRKQHDTALLENKRSKKTKNYDNTDISYIHFLQN